MKAQVWVTVIKEGEQDYKTLDSALVAVNGNVTWITHTLGLVEIYIPIDDEQQKKSDLSSLDIILHKWGFKRMNEEIEDTDQKGAV